MSNTEQVLARNITRDQLVERLRALRPEFARRGVTHMALFGSRARGDNRPDSDIDLIIDVSPEQKFSLIDLVGIGHVVEDSFGVSGDVSMRRSLPPYLVEEARRDAVEVF
jgi:predicted nucleotidyltransferase